MTIRGSILAAVFVAGIAAPAAAQTITVIASNPQGSVYYTVCVALAKVLDAKLGLQVRVQPMGGSTMYIPLLDRGEVEFALTNVDDTPNALRGTGNFKRPNPNLRPIAVMFPLPVGIMVPDDSPVRTVADLKGKMMPGGFQAQVIGRVLNAALLATGGLTDRDIRIVPTPTQFSGVDLLGEGKVDAAVISVGTAQAQRAHAELSSRGGVRFLDLGNSPSVAAAIRKHMVARPILVQPAPARIGVKGPTWLMAFNAFLTTHAKTPDELAYRVAKVLYDSKDELARTAPVLVNFDPKRMTEEFGVPWHPGAIKFYTEVGQWPPRE